MDLLKATNKYTKAAKRTSLSLSGYLQAVLFSLMLVIASIN